MLKQPACAAAINSSGLVPLPSPNRALNEYGVSFSVALCVVRLPLPSLPLPCHSALACRLMLAMEHLLFCAALIVGGRKRMSPGGGERFRLATTASWAARNCA